MSRSFNQFLEKQGYDVNPHKAKGRKLATQPTGPRAIDREGGHRTRPMKVILASMARTGTMSMYVAFQKLGLSPYHMAEAMKTPERDLEIACEAVNASSFGEGKPFGREEFDKWIGDYDAVCDVPMCLLVKELVEAYPDAKVVLTTRDPIKWHKSIENTVLRIHSWRVWDMLALVSPECKTFCNFKACATRAMDGWSIEALNRHNEGVRSVVPKERLLEFKLGRDGWKELCDHLEIPEPEGDFPNTNDGKLFLAAHIFLLNLWTFNALKRVTVRFAPFVIVAGSAIWYAKMQGYL